MFKTATVFMFSPSAPVVANALLDGSGLSSLPFVPTEPTAESSIGWVCPDTFDHAGQLAAVVGTDLFMRARIEVRKVPPATLKREVEKQVSSIERETGRRPGRKERKELTETVRFELLPKAFPKQTDVQVAYLHGPQLLVIESTSRGVVDAVADLVMQTFPGATLKIASTTVSPLVAMTAALAVADVSSAAGHRVGGSCLLKTADGRTVAYKSCDLNRPEIRTQIAEGFMVERLALEADSVSFELDRDLVLHKLDIFDDQLNAQADGTFDGSAAIFAGVFSLVWSDLSLSLGGLT